MQSRYDNEEQEVCQGGLPKKIFPKRITSAEEISLNDKNKNCPNHKPSASYLVPS